ncbi:hypothetical protein K457DRAFT_802297 [Linnemannia elongata AG-77]|uniref:Uncharacterized protein n=1 Tax=Linnemannia elongata AG-77 TaxID=1314771 RepID=A0A197JI42_9FUNG|nr:hypothetical protein K457DRAFT_802297 [Linnemannia elongata AG-77]
MRTRTNTRTIKMPVAIKKIETQPGIMATNTAASQVLSTYELTWMTTQHLGPTSIVRLSMTGWFLYQALNPLFWAHLDLYKTNQSKYLPLCVPVQQALSRNLSKIKTIKLDNSTLLHFVAGIFRQPNNTSRAAARTPHVIHKIAPSKKTSPNS